MAFVASFLVGLCTYFLFKKIDFGQVLKSIWNSNQEILSLLQSNVSDESKQVGILSHSRNLFMASCKLLVISIVIVLPMGMFYWIYRAEFTFNEFIIQTGLINLAGILVGPLIFRFK